MTDSEKNNIERYCKYFESLLNDIDALQGRPLFKSSLLFGVLDALSRSVYPLKKHRDRMTSFVKQFRVWSDSSRISLLHLTQLLRLVPDPVFEELRRFASERFNQLGFAIGNKPSINVDPEIEEVRKLWPKNAPTELPGSITLDSLQHISLFYAFRNTIVHELRTPGYGFDYDDRDEPFYHHLPIMHGAGEVEETVQLVYPITFMRRLCSNSLANLKQYLLNNNLNPYASYDFGTYWLPDLNE